MAESHGSLARSEQTVEVAVVGGGLSGLAAALLLVQARRSVVVLEASDRAGGRILNGDVGGAVCELGAEWVSPAQPHIQALLKDFGIATFDTYITGMTTLYFDGKVTRFAEPPPPLPMESVAEIVAAIAQIDLMAADIPLEAPWTAPEAASWDAQTVATWIDDNIFTDAARTTLGLMTSGGICVAPRDLSLLHYLFIAASQGGAEKLGTIKGGVLECRIVGGSGVLIEKLTAELGERVVLNAPVRRIDQSGSKVRLSTDRGGVTADHVIVAVPPTMAGRIAYDPPLPAARDQLTQRAPMGAAIKCFASYPTAFWREAGLNGFVNNLTPGAMIDGVFDCSPLSGTPGALLGLIEGDAAREWGPRPAAERKTAVLEAFATYFGPEARTPTDYREKDWATEPWIRGGATMAFAPGTWTEYGPALREPVDRIHWAGAETATAACGSMDGAISAAARAVQEVLAAGEVA
jgi:monoamine oxidase